MTKVKSLSERYESSIKRWWFVDCDKYEKMLRFEAILINKYNTSMSLGRDSKRFHRGQPNHYLSGGSVMLRPIEEDISLLEMFESEYEIPEYMRISSNCSREVRAMIHKMAMWRRHILKKKYFKLKKRV
ncbi:hypothetical protein N9043_00220 [bacterium]|nr:hypothetical protein [bacterium]